MNSYSFIFSFLVNKHAPVSNVHIHLNMERAEDEIIAESVYNYCWREKNKNSRDQKFEAVVRGS